MIRRNPPGWSVLLACALSLAAVLVACSAHAQAGQPVFVLYAKRADDTAAAQYLTLACNALAESKSKDPILFLDRSDSAIDLLRIVMQAEEDQVAGEPDGTSDPCAQANASATATNLRDCLVQRANEHMNSEQNSSLTPCFDPALKIKASGLVAVEFEDEAHGTSSLQYRRFRLEPGPVMTESVAYLTTSKVQLAAIAGTRTALGLQAPEPLAHPFPKAAVISGSVVAGVAGIAAAVLTSHANDTWEKAKAACASPDTPGGCPADSKGPSLSQEAKRAGNWATACTVASAVGGAVVVGALIYHYLIRPKRTAAQDAPAPTMPALDVAVSGASAYVTVGGNF